MGSRANELAEGMASGTYKDNWTYRDGIDGSLPPLRSISEIFLDLTKKVQEHGFQEFVDHLGGRPLRVGTMCSGTESPILALGLVAKHLAEDGVQFNFEHVLSAEIVAWKQHYIESNFQPPVLFRDIIELSTPHDDVTTPRTATTAYGGSQIVPGDLDLLVAGFSCVDFSGLNNSRKELEARGESGDTFFAMRAYAMEYHPKIIILENVTNAPWVDAWSSSEKEGDQDELDEDDGGPKSKRRKAVSNAKKGKKLKAAPMPGDNRGIDFHMREAGYACRHLKLDTKAYYLPHTRLRGYMVCVHRASFRTPEDIEAMLDTWQRLVIALQRPASVPVEAIMFKSDDSQLETDISQSLEVDRKPIAWEKCQVGHCDYRRDLNLGDGRPITHWSSGSSKVLPDFYKSMQGLTPRVLDTLDIAHLRNLRRGFDDRYYSRILELSQNVFRVTDNTKRGIIGCLTPSGMPFSTVRGRITGRESIILQGLPVEQLDLSQLDQGNLQDLAGNAMTSTVVGAVTLAALTTFHTNLFGGSPSASYLRSDASIPRFLGGALLDEFTVDQVDTIQQWHNDEALMKRIMELADATVKICLCEGRHTTLYKSFQRCQSCGYVTCRTCGKNPKHDYKSIPLDISNKRRSPCEFEGTLMEHIPMSFEFTMDNNSEFPYILDKIFSQFPSEESHNDAGLPNRDEVIGLVKAALSSTVYFRSLRRRHIWEVIHDSTTARLVQHISGESIECYLYAKVPPELAVNHPLRRYLEKFPIARKLHVTNRNTFQQGWQIWEPVNTAISATITSSGPLLPSFEQTRGFKDYSSSSVTRFCEVQFEADSKAIFGREIRGRYWHSPQCGQAFNSMHVQECQDTEENPLFLFFDHQLMTGDYNQHYWIFSTCQQRLDFNEHRSIVARLPPTWRQPRFEKAGADGDLEHPQIDEVDIFVDGRWRDCTSPDNYYTPPLTLYGHLRYDLTEVSFDCRSRIAVFSAYAKVPEQCNHKWPRDQITTLKKSDTFNFFEEFLWALQRGLINPIDAKRSQSSHQKEWQIVGNYRGRCFECAPCHPALLWALDKKGKQVPFEEPHQARDFERALKGRPSAFTINFSLGHLGDLALEIGFNPLLLAHQAHSLLVDSDPSIITTLSWRLITNGGISDGSGSQPFMIRDTQLLTPANHPLTFGTLLRPEQLRCLSWMIMQEADPRPFTEVEVVEAVIHEIGYRGEGRASRDVTVLGGIQAQATGFGKTATILALIDTMRGMMLSQTTNSEEGLIPLAATIIFTPPHLTSQWRGEVAKFLPNMPDERILVIETTAKLSKLSISDFQRAEIIIVDWDICRSNLYQTRVGRWAGMLEPAEKSATRAKAVWYESALRRARQNVQILLNSPESLDDALVEQIKVSMIAAASIVTPVPSKRTKGAAYENYEMRANAPAGTNYKKRKTGMTDEEPKITNTIPTPHEGSIFGPNVTKRSPREWFSLKFPLLELFNFNRVVIDEWAYVEGDSRRLIENLKANSRWILSATPSLSSFSDIKKMARLMGINLGVDDYSGMKRPQLREALKDLTSSEQFLAYQPAPSPAWQYNRHLHAQEFLHHYVRKDAANVGEFDASVHYRLLRQPPAEHLIYVELVQKLIASDFQKIRSLGPADYVGSLYERFDNGKEVLLAAASLSAFQNRRALGLDMIGKSDCQILVEDRQATVEALQAGIRKNMKKAVWLEANKEGPYAGFVNFKSLIANSPPGDPDVVMFLRKEIQVATETYHPDDWRQFYYGPDSDRVTGQLPFPTGKSKKAANMHLHESVVYLKDTVGSLFNHVDSLIDQQRSLRLSKNVEQLSEMLYQQPDITCNKCGNLKIYPHELFVLSCCGHILCKACYIHVEGPCPTIGCSTSYKPHQVISANDLKSDGLTPNSMRYGHKITEILRILVSLPADEKALVFVQIPMLHDAIMAALNSEGLSYLDLSGDGSPAQKLEHFKEITNSSRVLILNIGDASAAGSNLTVANHMLFVHPYLTEGVRYQETYDAAMTQALGRTLRFGQRKHVHVYHLLTANTLDIDLFESRNHGIIKDAMPVTQTAPFAGYQHLGVDLTIGEGVQHGQFSSSVAFEILEKDTALHGSY